MRTIASSTTLNWFSQSDLDSRDVTTFSAALAGEGMEIRNKMMPHEAFAPLWNTSSPKSLPKVRRSRDSVKAFSKTESSPSPGWD
jgi:hypothetical protein